MERKNIELDARREDLRRSEERYHKMIEEVQDYAIILMSPEGDIENWNKGAERIKGYKAEEIIGKNFRQFYTEKDLARKQPEKLLQEARITGRAMDEGWRVRKDGSLFWGSISITAIHDDKNEVIGFSKVTRDLTERKAAEEKLKTNAAELEKKNQELQKSEMRYHRMIAEVEEYAIILLSPEGIIENWNKGAEKIKGYKANEIVGKHFSKFYTPEDRTKKLPEKVLNEAATKGRATHEGWRVRKDGSLFWGSIVLTALHDEKNEIIGFSKVTRDLTERKNSEENLKANTKDLEEKNRQLEQMNQALSSFAYVSSHDLQEPLRKIQTFTTRITELETNLTERGLDYFQRIQNAAKRMQVLIEDLLTYSRTSTDERKFETVDLNTILEDVKNDLKEKIEEKHAVIKSGDLPVLNVIAFQFRQLLTNLIGNSIKFSKSDVPPKIQITSALEKGSSKFPGTDAAKDYHHITVTDNGIGFESEYNTKIFEVFQRLHGRSEYSGTGIGLAICKKIIENHHGFISAEGETDKGATFHLLLPAQQ